MPGRDVTIASRNGNVCRDVLLQLPFENETREEKEICDTRPVTASSMSEGALDHGPAIDGDQGQARECLARYELPIQAMALRRETS